MPIAWSTVNRLPVPFCSWPHQTFEAVVYEDELDLLTVVAVTQTDSEGRAHVNLHCNETGRVLKKTILQESWDVVRYAFASMFYFLLFFTAVSRIGIYILLHLYYWTSVMLCPIFQLERH